jgi:hypothetical protein
MTTAWTVTSGGLSRGGTDIEMDQAGQPRLAFRNQDGMSSCTRNRGITPAHFRRG